MTRIVLRALIGVALIAFQPVTTAQAQTSSAAKLTQGAGDDRAVARERRHRDRSADADARHCLDLPTNTLIIKCAEKYL